ncbi:MAG: TlpA family protein disulfide reductase [Actinomycetota bacterium]|nr:TlpA family protein disulfide reductase [Actinomycetota bacterium]
MRRAAGVLLLALVLTACTGGSDAVNQSGGGETRFVAGNSRTGVLPAADRKPAPAVSGPLLDGSPYDLRSLEGRVVVVNFWGSWCAPCRAEAATLERVYQSSRSSGVQFVGVDVKDETGPATAFQRAQGISYPSLFDRAGAVAVRFRDLPPAAIPTTLVIDRLGRVAARFLGGVTEGELGPVVASVAGERA